MALIVCMQGRPAEKQLLGADGQERQGLLIPWLPLPHHTSAVPVLAQQSEHGQGRGAGRV